MTREEALNILHNASVYHPDYLDALNMAIKALEQEPCEDAISRQAVIDALQPYIDANKDSDDLYLSGCGDGAYHALHTIKALPPVQSIRPKGEWILEQEPFVNNSCVYIRVCEHNKSKVLDKIRAEIDKERFIDKDTRTCKNALASGLEVAMEIIDKYKAESEEE